MRLLEEYLCPLCREREASYYCESCFLAFCSSCSKRKVVQYAVCEKCGEVHLLDKPGRAEPCSICGHDRLRLGVRKLSVCPRCLSESVSDLNRKREEHAAKLREVARALLSASSAMLDVVSSVSKAKSRLLALRRSGFLHDPNLEGEVLGLYESVSALKLKAISKAEVITGSLVSRVASLLREWSPLRIREIEACFGQIEGALREYRQLVEEECRALEDRLKQLSTSLDHLEFHRRLFEEFKWLLDVGEKEKPVCAIPRVKYAGSSYLASDKGEGILFLTTERLVFLKREGLLRRSYKKHFSVALDEVEEVRVRRRLRRSFTVKTSKGTVSFRAPPHVLENVEAYFALAKNFGENSQSDRSLTLKLEGAAVGLSDFRRAVASLMESALKSNEGGRKSQDAGAQPPQPPPPPPQRRPTPPPPPPTVDQESLLELEKKRFAVEQSLKRLKELWERGEVSLEEYLKFSRRLEGDLYEINVKIESLKGASRGQLQRA